MARGGLRHVEDSGEIYSDHFVPFFRSDVEEVVADADAGIVDEDIDSAHRADCAGEGSFDMLEAGDVGDEGFGDGPQLLTNGFAGSGVAIEDADSGAFLEETRGGGSA